jgi:hypothetical protein
MKNDKCSNITIVKIKQFIKKTDPSIKLTGNKEVLCDKYNKLAKPQHSLISSQRLNVIKEWFKGMKTVTEIRKFNAEIYNLSVRSELELNKNNPTKEYIYQMLNNNQSMNEIIAEMNKIDNEFDRETIGLYAMDDKDLLLNYTKADRRKFIKLMGRDITEDCFDEYNKKKRKKTK